MIWKKPEAMKYTEMCMYIDENVPKIVNPGEFPEIESTIYNYLWLLVKALAIKKCMFTNFQDYDPYAFYAASRLFFALRKNQINQGQVIKGKLIRPIKSCLNYTKALLYPMKIEYQRENYQEVISEEALQDKFDAYAFSEQLRSQVMASQGSLERFITNLEVTISFIGKKVDAILEHSPFIKDTTEYKYIKISMLLNCLYSLKTKHRLNTNPQTIILWKLPKSIASYIKILLKELYTSLEEDITACYEEAAPYISDSDLKKMLETGVTDNYEDQY